MEELNIIFFQKELEKINSWTRFSGYNDFEAGSPIFNFKNGFSDSIKKINNSSKEKFRKQMLRRIYNDSIITIKKITMTQTSMKFLFTTEVALVLLIIIIF